ncbi:hypothetical protein BDD12DRAFT_899920 [Trichophaea hybrida]|nr:hypothetical protein BDD12DRAFT_899920 [Trichophaea hybrida]
MAEIVVHSAQILQFLQRHLVLSSLNGTQEQLHLSQVIVKHHQANTQGDAGMWSDPASTEDAADDSSEMTELDTEDGEVLEEELTGEEEEEEEHNKEEGNEEEGNEEEGNEEEGNEEDGNEEETVSNDDMEHSSSDVSQLAPTDQGIAEARAAIFEFKFEFEFEPGPGPEPEREPGPGGSKQRKPGAKERSI